ncbi:MAG: YadA-like family protein [Erythrobacter sp.]
MGSSTLVTAQFGTAVGREANVTHGNSTAVGYQATTTATNQVALGGAGSSVQISDIDASTAAQQGPVDVVTVDAIGTLGRQQAATAQSVQNVQVAIDSIAQVSDAQFTALSSSVSQLSGRVDSLFDLSTTINRDAQRGIASIAAQANPHFPSAAGKTSYASNVATYRGEVGFSAGLMHRFQGDFAITAGVTYAGGNSTSIKAGVAGEF